MSLPSEHTASHHLVDHFFRHEYGRLLGRLTRVLGNRNWEIAEDSVQAAMHEALRTWGPRGIPSDPGGWLYRVAHRKAIDNLRRTKRHKKFLDLESNATNEFEDSGIRFEAADFDNSIQDDRLRMLFLCCDPAIPSESQIAMTLKLSAGFSISEISRALLTNESTIQKRITRAKEKLRETSNNVERFADLNWEERVPSVLQTIYLIFN
ncbi:MAG: sigma-70 family RNA polymerase sigma factor, partial [Pirellula sp.]|nr:sigma-70 family RNA polymerase sigma factor [Pirellula sp.]